MCFCGHTATISATLREKSQIHLALAVAKAMSDRRRRGDAEFLLKFYKTLRLIQKIVAKADRMVGSGLWEKIRKMLSD